ncbi:hypothetical protein [Mesorhizobium sp. M0118]|uniref:hypothetical protein n=1 Tax=Mesorhizobium sp. M0118 TaxID=2956884 RepID=UPI00333BAE31
MAGANARITHGIAGATITAGQWVYLDSTTGKYGLADTDSATAGVRSAIGVALNSASANQPLAVQSDGLVTIGGAILAGVAYYLSGTPGAMCPIADVAAGDYPLVLGMGVSTTVLDISIVYPAVVLA